MTPLEIWKRRVAGSVRVLDPNDIERIARMCLDAEEKGENFAVWHNAARFYKTPCNCAQCRPDIERFPYPPEGEG